MTFPKSIAACFFSNFVFNCSLYWEPRSIRGDDTHLAWIESFGIYWAITRIVPLGNAPWKSFNGENNYPLEKSCFISSVSNVCIFLSALNGTLVRRLTWDPEVQQCPSRGRIYFCDDFTPQDGSDWNSLLSFKHKPSYRQLQIMCKDSFQKVVLSVRHTWSMFSLWDWRILTTLQRLWHSFSLFIFFLHFYLFTKLICILLLASVMS